MLTLISPLSSPSSVVTRAESRRRDGELSVWGSLAAVRSWGVSRILAMMLVLGALAAGLLFADTAFAETGAAETGAAEEESPWASFRGNAEQTGVATSPLAAELKPRWVFEADDAIEATAAIAGGRVYVASMGGTLYALSLEDGEVVWSYDAGAAVRSAPLVAKGTVYFGDEGGVLHAVKVEDGEERFKVTTEGEVTSAPNLAEGCLLFGSYDQNLYCVDPVSGEQRWAVETANPVHGSPAIHDGAAVSAGCDGVLRRVRLSDGKVTTEIPLGGYVASSVAVVGDKAYVGSYESEVLGLDLAAAEVLWRYRHPTRKFPFYASAAVSGDHVVIAGRDKMVHALNRESGEAHWTFPTRARIDGSPVIVGDRVFAGGQTGVLYALALKDGEELWSYDLGAPLDASPAVGEGHLVLGNADGLVYAFGGP
ncbi:MAG: PQQ-binding-like beta-propeller repeat protein [Acidobacteriota bacterium]